jgi:hypothetical protein
MCLLKLYFVHFPKFNMAENAMVPNMCSSLLCILIIISVEHSKVLKEERYLKENKCKQHIKWPNIIYIKCLSNRYGVE